jgi:hypothetical protein
MCLVVLPIHNLVVVAVVVSENKRVFVSDCTINVRIRIYIESPASTRNRWGGRQRLGSDHTYTSETSKAGVVARQSGTCGYAGGTYRAPTTRGYVDRV